MRGQFLVVSATGRAVLYEGDELDKAVTQGLNAGEAVEFIATHSPTGTRIGGIRPLTTGGGAATVYELVEPCDHLLRWEVEEQIGRTKR